MRVPLSEKPAVGASARLLLVEDEAIIALSESMTLKRSGYAVETAGSGEAAVERFGAGEDFDLVLMDIDLGPGMDGTEAARAILATRRVPIVFLTSHSSKAMVEKVRSITRYGYIVKSSGEFVMLSTVEMALDLTAKERDLEERDLILCRAEEAARIGYWFVAPGASEIQLSSGSREILGIDAESCSFEEFQGRVLVEASERRARAFGDLIAHGTPYDLSYRVHKADTGEIVTIHSSAQSSRGSILGIIQDVSGIESLLGELRRAEERQAVTLRSIGDGVIATDTLGRVMELNPMAEALTGWKTTDAFGRPVAEVFKIVNAATRETVQNPVQKVIESGYIVGLANHTVLIARDGAERHIADSAAPIRDEGGVLLGMVLVFRDVTEEYEAQRELERDAEVFRTLFEGSPTPMLIIEPGSGAIRGANLAAQGFYGWKVDELTAMNIDQVNTLDREAIAGEMAVAKEGIKEEFRFVHRRADGSLRRVLVTSGPVRYGEEICLLSIVRDATEDYNREMERVAERERSEALIRDARHRLKNNVQIISSLIQIQASEAEEEGRVLAALDKLQYRISGMALVYDQLYTVGDRDCVDSKPYLSSLLEALGEGYFSPAVGLRSAVEDCVLGSRLAVSIGLILSELVMNACKHAFPPGRGGTVEVEFRRAGEGLLSLAVRDDGVGMGNPKAAGSGGRSGIGLALVESLVSQEGGELETETGGPGTAFTCRFPYTPQEGAEGCGALSSPWPRGSPSRR